jgi:hypothetical protein
MVRYVAWHFYSSPYLVACGGVRVRAVESCVDVVRERRFWLTSLFLLPFPDDLAVVLMNRSRMPRRRGRGRCKESSTLATSLQHSPSRGHGREGTGWPIFSRAHDASARRVIRVERGASGQGRRVPEVWISGAHSCMREGPLPSRWSPGPSIRQGVIALRHEIVSLY